MADVASALAGVDDKTQQNLLGVQIFGTMYEDQGRAITDTLINAQKGTADLKKDQDALNDSVSKWDESPAVAWAKAMKELKAATAPMLTIIAEIVQGLGEWIQAHPKLAAAITSVASVLAILVGLCMALAPVLYTLSSLIPIIGAGFAAVSAPVWIVIGAIAALAAGLALLFINNEKIHQALTSAWSSIKSVTGSALKMIAPLVEKLSQGFSHLMDSVSGLFKGDFSQLSTIFAQLAPTIIGLLVGGLPGILISASKFLPAIADALSSNMPVILSAIQGVVTGLASFFTTQFPTIIQAVVNGINTVLPTLLNAGVQIIQAIITGITTVLPVILLAAAQIITMLINGIVSVLPTLVPVVTQIITTIVNLLTQLLPTILQAGLTIILALVNGIIQNLPTLLTAAIQIITALINGIIQILPMLINAALQLIVALVNALIANLPLIIAAGVKILLALIDGIIKILPQLIAAVIILVVAILNALVTNLPKIIAAGVKILLALITGIIKVLPQLIGAVIKLTIAIVTALIKAVPQLLGAGVKLILALIKGIGSMAGTLGKAALDLGGKILDNLSKINLRDIGKNIIQGLINGITSMFPDITSWVKKAADLIPHWLRKRLDINSPSRVTTAIGAYVGEGLTNGIHNSIGNIRSAASRMATAAVPDVKQADFNASVSGAGNGSSGGGGNTYNFDGMFAGANFHVRNDNDIEKLAAKIGDYILSAR